MTISDDLLIAANEFGAALGAIPDVQEYVRVREALMKDAELQQLEEKIERVYQELVTRQQNGEMLMPGEMNGFFELREIYTNHPLVIEYGRRQSAIKALFGEIGSTISSILSVEYTQLAG
jgi:cell fate (sporulation/competence/biofilm development) regulator YlbF (YheA/YmcA/DUF963 family)